jgi:hypothetical protein
MERSVRDKHSSTLRKFVNYRSKSFISFGPGSTMVEHATHNSKIEGSNPVKIKNGQKLKTKCLHVNTGVYPRGSILRQACNISKLWS